MFTCATRSSARVAAREDHAVSTDSYDALVVGGGPAGAACAYWLAEAGRRVLVVEKKRFPRDKTCGDGLTPRAVRQLLLTTARSLPNAPVEQQGFGVLDAKNAVAKSILEIHGGASDFPDSPVIDWFNQRIIFYYHNDEAKSVALAGSFNDWRPNAMLFSKNGRGIWKAEISMLPKGTHLYKFVLDGKEWVADPENSHREPDGFNGLNSKVVIE